MLQLVMILLTAATLLLAQDQVQRGIRDREFAAQATASRLQTIAEAAQRYATDTRVLRPGVQVADLTLMEIMAAGYLAPGFSSEGPFGGAIQLTARLGAYDHVVVDLALPVPDERAEPLRLAMAGFDAGGGQVSLQATAGATRFVMPGVASALPLLRLSGSVKAGQVQGDDSTQ